MSRNLITIHDFLEAVTTLSIEFDLSVTSWIRTQEHNIAVKGVWNSLHLCGLAVDVILDNRKEIEVFSKRCERFGLRVLNEGTHLHVQVD